MGMVLVFDDLTELLKAQRLAAWREVAQRIAHEIKNPLTPIQLSAQRLRRRLGGDRSPDEKRLLEEATATIIQEVDGLKQLVDEFSRFARMPALSLRPTDLAPPPRRRCCVLYRESHPALSIRSVFSPDVPQIEVDPNQLRRAVLNLVDNAVEAVGQAGEVLVETVWLPDSRRARIVVADSGPGITPEDRERLFVPYFSTKATGMGLGLRHRAPDRHRPRRHDLAGGQCPPGQPLRHRAARGPPRAAPARAGLGAHAGEHILIVDDERAIQATLKGVLEDEGYRVSAVGSAPGALARLADETPDLIFLDIWMPGMDGLEALAEVKQRRPEATVVMISGHGTIETAVKATKLGAYDFIEKPLSLEKTLLAVARALDHSRLERENRALRERLERGQEIVGESALIEDAAPADRHRRAHQRPRAHPRRERHRQGAGGARHPRAAPPGATAPFVEVNCAAIPEELIETELFGHERGAFTGAVARRRRGKFEQADGGTLFLDEIGDMSLKTQAKVLRVLEEQSFERVGGKETLRVDVRVLAATNQDLKEQIAQGRFREDLYYRLERHPDRGAAAAPPQGGHPRAGRALHRPLLGRERQARRRRCPWRPSPTSSPTTGRATCASCATWSSAW